MDANAVHQHSKPKVPSTASNLIGLDLPLTALIGVTGKWKQILTYTQETTRAKLE
jgi:hypothetical protein